MSEPTWNCRNVLAGSRENFALLLGEDEPIDFRSQEFNWKLSKKLLEKHFNLKIEAPIDSLCPTIPSRYDYVCFIRELEVLTRFSHPELIDESVCGIDM